MQADEPILLVKLYHNFILIQFLGEGVDFLSPSFLFDNKDNRAYQKKTDINYKKISFFIYASQKYSPDENRYDDR